MNAGPMIDAQRLSLMLNELRLPTIKHIWGDFAAQADKEGWPAGSSPRWPSTSSPNARPAGSNATSQRPICPQARPWIASPSMPCR